MSETRDTSLNRSIAETRSNNRNGKFSDTDVENDDNSLGTRWSITSDDITSTTSQSSCSSTDKDSSSQKATFVTLESASSHSSDYHTIATPDQYIINEELPDFEPTIAEACEEYSKLNARNIEDCAATVILDKNTVITVDFKEFAQISPYFRAAFYGGFSETKSKLLIFDRSKVCLYNNLTI
ncbi:unnamed protein product [Thelazia callipaeda]|uniref:BTB domain-containing protein n=1 Tax=Thelazia callipaeda TaxID=103827 RepID=A0A0N5D8Z4_THECL|nr:unnamed protein product [Thelazia callipaeda]